MVLGEGGVCVSECVGVGVGGPQQASKTKQGRDRKQFKTLY